MPLDRQPVLQGDLLELRPLRAEDFDDLFAVASDPQIWAQHPEPDRYTEERFRVFFRDAMASGGALIAIDRGSGRIIGSSRYHDYDADKREVEIGWSFLARSHWGGRYNGEMKRLMLQHAFPFVDRVHFVIGPENMRSRRAVEKIGGVLVRQETVRGQDRVVYELTPSAYERTRRGAASLLRSRDYMLLWSGQVISTLGTSASMIVYPLLILALTNSPAAAGVAGACNTIPYLVFSLPVGALIDRWDRKRVMILCDVGRALTLASIPLAMLFHVLTIWQIYAASLVEGSLFVFFNIAEVAALPRVVTREQLPGAAAQNEAGFGAASIVGPSMGTVLFQTVGRAMPFIADAASYVVSVVSLAFIRTRFQAERVATAHNLRAELVEGLRWLWSKPLIRFMAFLTGGTNMIHSGAPLLLILLAKQMGAQNAQIGLIMSIGGVGGIVGSLIGGRIQRRFSFGQVIIGVMWTMALLFPLYAIAPGFLWLGAITALIAVTIPVYNVVQFSYRLALIPDRLQGRVNSTFRLLAFGFRPLGALLSGVLLERIGAVNTVIAFSLATVLLAILTTANVHVRNAQPIEVARAE